MAPPLQQQPTTITTLQSQLQPQQQQLSQPISIQLQQPQHHNLVHQQQQQQPQPPHNIQQATMTTREVMIGNQPVQVQVLQHASTSNSALGNPNNNTAQVIKYEISIPSSTMSDVVPQAVTARRESSAVSVGSTVNASSSP